MPMLSEVCCTGNLKVPLDLKRKIGAKQFDCYCSFNGQTFVVEPLLDFFLLMLNKYILNWSFDVNI